MQERIVAVDSTNLAKQGFFCYMSKRKNPGWAEKAGWLKTAFPQGLQLRLLEPPERGFIEYLPVEQALRPVTGTGYLFIHCLWIVGKSKGQGHAGRLLQHCIADAREHGLHGVAMVASDTGYMKLKDFLTAQDFRTVDSAPYGYELLALSFDDAPAPRFCGGWQEKAAAHPEGVTILKTGQCPYFHDFTAKLTGLASNQGLPVKIVELTDAAAVRSLAPTPYGTYNVVVAGKAVPIYFDAPKFIGQQG